MKRRTKSDRQAPLFWGITPNQLVGYNLWRARQERGWTQSQAADALAPHLGVRWTVAQVSAAEHSIDGARIRQFTADDLVAFAQAFDLPVTYFFLPPSPAASWSKVDEGTSSEGLNRTMAVMIDLIFGDLNEGAPQVVGRLHEVMRDLDVELYSAAQRQVFHLARQRLLAIVARALDDIAECRKSLVDLNDALAGIESDVTEQLARTFPEISSEDVAALLGRGQDVARSGEGRSGAAPAVPKGPERSGGP
ncbi:MAG TPA: helix-turn-helix transcriptional regulator [Acidimicrobiales bacterium]|nr:helix-turn-helix transcriptional regulator [Acidimicrobiales bacterium]